MSKKHLRLWLLSFVFGVLLSSSACKHSKNGQANLAAACGEAQNLASDSRVNGIANAAGFTAPSTVGTQVNCAAVAAAAATAQVATTCPPGQTTECAARGSATPLRTGATP